MSKASSYIKKKTELPKLSLSTLTKLQDLFLSKGWEINDSSSISYFSKYVQTLLTLQPEQQDFLVNLSRQFIHLPIQRYLKHLLKPLQELRSEYPNTNLLFACCLPKEDIGKNKSSQAVLYQLKGSSIKTEIDINPYMVIESWEGCKWEYIKNSNFRIILVDDFIGTGETAVDAAGYIEELYPEINPGQISFLSIVVMKEGKAKIEACGHKVYSSIQCGKGISDVFTGEELVTATRNMQEIESTLKSLDKEYMFGYKQSEALVCMERCPNNTFPIYWLTRKTAPYER